MRGFAALAPAVLLLATTLGAAQAPSPSRPAGRAARGPARNVTSLRSRSKTRSISLARSTTASGCPLPAGYGAHRRRGRSCPGRGGPGHADGYVRFRSLVLLSGFNDPRTHDVMARAVTRQERSPACRRLRVLRAQPRSADGPPDARRADHRAVRVRPARTDARAGRVRERCTRARRVERARREGTGFLPQRGHRGDRGLQGRVRAARVHRGGQARWAAAGRRRAGARKDRRQEVARHARPAPAHGAPQRATRRSPRRSACLASIARRT